VPIVSGSEYVANLRTSCFSLFQNRRLGDVQALSPLKMLAIRHLLRELECTSHSLLLPRCAGA
jgi:hypothetical protein